LCAASALCNRWWKLTKSHWIYLYHQLWVVLTLPDPSQHPHQVSTVSSGIDEVINGYISSKPLCTVCLYSQWMPLYTIDSASDDSTNDETNVYCGSTLPNEHEQATKYAARSSLSNGRSEQQQVKIVVLFGSTEAKDSKYWSNNWIMDKSTLSHWTTRPFPNKKLEVKLIFSWFSCARTTSHFCSIQITHAMKQNQSLESMRNCKYFLTKQYLFVMSLHHTWNYIHYSTFPQSIELNWTAIDHKPKLDFEHLNSNKSIKFANSPSFASRIRNWSSWYWCCNWS
jgi:hypothetical protein